MKNSLLAVILFFTMPGSSAALAMETGFYNCAHTENHSYSHSEEAEPCDELMRIIQSANLKVWWDERRDPHQAPMRYVPLAEVTPTTIPGQTMLLWVQPAPLAYAASPSDEGLQRMKKKLQKMQPKLEKLHYARMVVICPRLGFGHMLGFNVLQDKKLKP